MGRLVDLAPGERFGRWVVLGIAAERSRTGKAQFLCECACGTVKAVLGASLIQGKSVSCGCLKRELLSARKTTHGHSRVGAVTREYGVWRHMLERCLNPADKSFKNYGGRGITVCDRWRFGNSAGPGGYECFRADVGAIPCGLSVDRRDNDGNYEPGNIRFTTPTGQRRNQRPISAETRAKLAAATRRRWDALPPKSRTAHIAKMVAARRQGLFI
jgi:hypothetical protein